MRVATGLVLACFVAVGVLAVGAQAAEKAKTVTLEGKIMCAKCSLKQESKCTTAIQVKEGDKEVTYLLKDKGNREEYHEIICGGDKKDGKVTGVVSTGKDGKKYIAPKKGGVEYKS